MTKLTRHDIKRRQEKGLGFPSHVEIVHAKKHFSNDFGRSAHIKDVDFGKDTTVLVRDHNFSGYNLTAGKFIMKPKLPLAQKIVSWFIPSYGLRETTLAMQECNIPTIEAKTNRALITQCDTLEELTLSGTRYVDLKQNEALSTFRTTQTHMLEKVIEQNNPRLQFTAQQQEMMAKQEKREAEEKAANKARYGEFYHLVEKPSENKL